MNEEKKTYSVVGTVTIGTDEYRDLIREKFEAEKEAEYQRHRWYTEYEAKQKLEEKNKKLSERLDSLEKFIKELEAEDKFDLWMLRIARGE